MAASEKPARSLKPQLVRIAQLRRHTGSKRTGERFAIIEELIDSLSIQVTILSLGLSRQVIKNQQKPKWTAKTPKMSFG